MKREKAEFYVLRNRNGLQLRLTNRGAALVSLWMPDRRGRFDDVLLGYDTLEEYRRDAFYLGAVVGRCANRIAGGKLWLHDKAWQLERNDGRNHLHGGHTGFAKRIWGALPYRTKNGEGIRLNYLSPDGEDGYPGNLQVEVRYQLNDYNALRIDYQAEADHITAVNLSNHAYFNLGGHSTGSILDHQLKILASRFTPVNGQQIPTGELAPVANTPMDFRRLRPIGESIDAAHPQLEYGQGFDHNWVLKRHFNRELRFAAYLSDPRSGRQLIVYTDQPGIHFYSGNHLDAKGKGGALYPGRSGLCLETQHYPDAVNHRHFPSVLLAPGRRFQSTTVLRFGVT